LRNCPNTRSTASGRFSKPEQRPNSIRDIFEPANKPCLRTDSISDPLDHFCFHRTSPCTLKKSEAPLICTLGILGHWRPFLR
jgi:hypothetical protein